MRKWWFLLAAVVLWNLLGYVLLGSKASESKIGVSQHKTPSRLISMAPNLTEILYALDLGPNVVGVTSYSDYPPAATEKPKVGTFWEPNIEAVIAAKPDLVVLLDFPQQKDLADRLIRMGYDCLSVTLWKIDEFFDTVTTVGHATGAAPQAERIVGDLKANIDRLQRALAGRSRPRVLWVVQREPLRVAGRDTFINELIELAGGQNAIGPTLHEYPPIGAEQVIASKAEVIIEPAMLAGDLAKQGEQALAHWSRFSSIPAVTEGRIHVIEGDVVSRLSPRLYQGIETITKCLHPEILGE